MDRYISVTDTAKLLRGALAKYFPGVKFSVRSKSYAGGASINVGWTDGPTETEVKTVTGSYAGGRFNSMVDMAYSAYHWMLPDGSIHFAGTTSDGMGDPGSVYTAVKPHPDAEMVHFGADYVFINRSHSMALKLRAAARVIKERGLDLTPEDTIAAHGDWDWTKLSRLTTSDNRDALHHLSRMAHSLREDGIVILR